MDKDSIKELQLYKHNTNEKDETKVIYLTQSQSRILFKSILYRLIGFSVTFFASYYFTGNYKKSFNIGFIIELSQTLIYYFYELFWNTIRWGYITNMVDIIETKT
jgi:uncharacterized membrane protein